MKADIKKQLVREVESIIDEMDIEGMIENTIQDKRVNQLVENRVKEMIADIVQEKAYEKIKKQLPIIDAWTSNKVTAFLMELGVK